MILVVPLEKVAAMSESELAAAYRKHGFTADEAAAMARLIKRKGKRPERPLV